jgi:hypothetical protein
MDRLAFYNAGCEPQPGVSRLKLWVRRQARKILLPPSIRLVQILSSLCDRLDAAEHEIRELREIQEHVDTLLCRDSAETVPALADSSVRFPGLEPAEADHAPRSKLG